MVKIKTYDSQERLQPTPMDPNTASNQGREIGAIGKTVGDLGESLQKLQNTRDMYKAEIALSQAHDNNRRLATTDPNLDSLEQTISDNTEKNITQSANLISDPATRDQFVAKSTLDMERRNVPLMNTIYRRQSQDVKQLMHAANDEDIKEYQSLGSPQERELVRNQIIDRTKGAIASGHINADVGQKHLDQMLKQMDVDQIKNDMSIDAQATYEHLQKGDEGLYPHVSPSIRKEYADKAQKLIAKQGSDRAVIYDVAQNHAENQLIDMMGQGTLNQETINNAQLIGINGIKVRPQFAKAATDALNEPFPTDSVPDKYNKLVSEIQDPDKDPIDAKMDVLNTRGITPQQKSHLLNSVYRPDDEEGKSNINNLINQGIQKNKQEILEANNKLNKEIKDRKTLFGKIGLMFGDHAKDATHLAELQQDYYSKVAKAKNNDERITAANEIINRDTLNRNPKIAKAQPKGSLFYDKLTNAKVICYPGGKCEEQQ